MFCRNQPRVCVLFLEYDFNNNNNKFPYHDDNNDDYEAEGNLCAEK